MRITFDLEFDHGSWPGPLGGELRKEAAIGEAWVGPAGLRDFLENALGLRGLYPSSAERIASLAKSVRAVEGFWSESAQKDAIGVGRVLLRWIDWLSIHGWKGQPPSLKSKAVRLQDLARLRPFVLAGGPDRLAAIAAALDKRRSDIESIETHEPIERMLPLWRSVFSKLQAQGVAIRTVDLPPVSSPPKSDLARSLKPKFTPSGDGSLALFRPYNPLDAAESIAAWLSALDSPSNVVIISPGAALDEALSRFGLPTTGARDSGGDDPFLQILPLVLAMGWNPPDPQRALELLLIPDGPVPGVVARRLRDALQEWPAICSPDWDENLTAGLNAIAESGYRDKIRERLSAIFRPDAKIRTPYPRAALKLRAAAVRKWAATRRNTKPEPAEELAARLDAVIGQCNLFEKLLDLAGVDALSEPQLLKIGSAAADQMGSSRRHPHQAGIATVGQPGAVAGAARHIIWWDFTMDSAPEPFALPFSRDELAALASLGVSLTPATEQAADQSRRWRRPFLRASESLILVCPVFGEDGEPRNHHPLWDEVTAGLSKGSDLSLVEKKILTPRRRVTTRKDPLKPVPTAHRSWTVSLSSEAVSRLQSHSHSPTGLQTLIGCPFKWTLRYLGRLRDPESAALAESSTLTGKLSHEILALVLGEKPANGRAARARALALFAELGPKLAAPLFLPGAPFQVDIAQKATADAAADIVEHLRRSGLQVTAVETSIEVKTARMDLGGRVDLIVGDPPVIIDLKWAGESYRRDQFRKGTALQLAAYARILQKGDSSPAVAFYIIMNQRLIVPKGTPFKGLPVVDGPPLQDTWRAAEATALARLDNIKKGRIEALAVPLAPPSDQSGVIKEDALDGERIDLTPPCNFCSFGYLCGINWEGGR
jgi:ATP-dependent helicase/nuclease subunit B